MPKDLPEDLTGSPSPELVKAFRTIGQGFIDLADALAPGTSAKPDPRPAAARSPETAPPPAEEPDDAQDEDSEIELADLQKMAKNLIKGGGRDKLLKILEELELENVSSAPTDKWAELKEKLEAASE